MFAFGRGSDEETTCGIEPLQHCHQFERLLAIDLLIPVYNTVLLCTEGSGRDGTILDLSETDVVAITAWMS